MKFTQHLFHGKSRRFTRSGTRWRPFYWRCVSGTVIASQLIARDKPRADKARNSGDVK